MSMGCGWRHGARFLLLALAVSGCSWRLPQLPLDIATLSLLLLAAGEGVQLVRERQWPSFLPLPFCLLFSTGVLCAVLVANPATAAIREMVQLGVLVGGALFVANGRTPHSYRIVIALALAVNWVAAIGQLVAPSVGASLVGWLYSTSPALGGSGPDLAEEVCTGLCRSQLQYAALATLALPFLLSVTTRRRAWHAGVRLAIGCAVTTLVSATVMSPLFLVAIWMCATLCMLGELQTAVKMRRYVFGLLAAAVLCGVFLTPGGHGVWRLRLFRDMPGRDREPSRLCVEYASALEALPSHSLGRGLGSYRESIRRVRTEMELPKPFENRVRRDSAGQFLVTSIECGWLGVLALCLLLIAPMLMGVGARRHEERSRLGSVVPLSSAYALLPAVACLTPVFVTGLGPLACLLLALGLQDAGCTHAANRSRRILMQAVLLALCLLAGGLAARWGSKRETTTTRQLVPRAPRASDFHVEAEQCEAIPRGWLVRPANNTGAHASLVIPLGLGKGAGAAVYGMTAPAAGEYRLWLRVLWGGGCANSVLCQIDGGRTVSVEDAVFGRWHWVDAGGGKTIALPKGSFTLTVKNSEDGVEIDQIAFLSALGAMPVGILGDSAEIDSEAPDRMRMKPLPQQNHPHESDADGSNSAPKNLFDKFSRQ